MWLELVPPPIHPPAPQRKKTVSVSIFIGAENLNISNWFTWLSLGFGHKYVKFIYDDDDNDDLFS